MFTGVSNPRSLLLAVALVACGPAAIDEGDESEARPVDAGPRPVERDKDAAPPKEVEPTKYGNDGGTFSCEQPLSSHSAGRRCGLDSASGGTCGGSRLFLYECEDEGGEPRRPNATCRDFQRYTLGGKSVTMSLCEQSACLPIDDPRCGSRKAYACPDTSRPGIPSTAPPVAKPQLCELGGTWAIDVPGSTASGPLLCCD